MADGKVRIQLQRFLTLLHRFVVAMIDAQCVRHVCADDQGKRIKAFRFSQLPNAFAIPPYDQQMPGIPFMRCGIAWIQLNGATVFLLGEVPLPAVQVVCESQRGVRLRQRRALLGMSQTAMGEAAGLSFRQIQKYESGKNSIAASRLYEFA